MAELAKVKAELRQPMYDAMVAEMQSVLSMKVFKWADMPCKAKPISTRMVLKTKLHAGGSFDKHKARLCVRGFMQKEGINYHDTFTPTSDLSLFRGLLSHAAPDLGPPGY